MISSPYQSTPLGVNDIRLLHLFPGAFDDNIICSLQRVNLDDSPAYETTSYVWGESTVRATVFVDGNAISIPVSAAYLLRRLRLENNSRAIWIDALCIKQNDLDERAKQVALMRSVYQRGKRNLIYLGESETAAEEIAELCKVHEEAKQLTENFSQLSSMIFSKDGSIVTSWERSQVWSDMRWDLLRKFMEIEWFSRVWVVQEAALSPRSLCLYGESEVPLVDILRTVVWMVHRYHYCLQLGDAVATTTIRFGLCLWHILFSTGGSKVGVRFILDLAIPLRATNLVDKAFGVLGLLEHIPNELLPDYRKPFEDVFRDATKFALRDSDSSDISRVFTRISHRWAEEVEDVAWPSWVPRWHRQWSDDSDPGPLRSFFNAHDGQSTQYMDEESHNNPRLLAYRGILVDKVTRLTSIMTRLGITRLRGFAQWYEEVKALRRSTPEELVSLLLCGANAEGAPLTEADRAVMVAYEQHHYGAKLTSIEGSDTYKQDDEADFEAFWRALCEDAPALRFWQTLVRAAKYRRAFATENDCLGYGPQMTQMGNVVVVLYGFMHPYVLRPCGTRYKMIGQCYVHGMMDGEAVRTHRAEGKEDVTFVLC